jgi:asparagine synthase (glutamine-hydrolysing)
MSTFILVRNSGATGMAERALRNLADLGHRFRLVYSDSLQSVYVGGRESVEPDCVMDPGTGDFIIGCGVFLCNGEGGVPALREFLARLNLERPSVTDTTGSFVVVARKGGRLVALTDRLGSAKIYRDRSGTIFSNSFLVLAESVTNPSLNRQGCYEIVWNGVTFGTETFLDDVIAVDVDTMVEFGDSIVEARMLGESYRDPSSASGLEACLERHLDSCRRLIGSYRSVYGSRISLSFSGGYDSRLLLALLLDVGIRPNLVTYGRPGDEECRIAGLIAEGESLPWRSTDNAAAEAIPADRYRRNVIENYAWFDAWRKNGLFDGGGDRRDRAERVRDGLVKMNGPGGEIFRNYFYLHGGTYTPLQIVWTFFARYDPSYCTEAFDPEEYENRLAAKLGAAVGNCSGRLSRQEVELVYPLVRLRYTIARSIAENSAFGPSLYPFLEPSVIRGTADIPLRYKNYGLLEGRMIRRLNPRLAAYPSLYGHNFAADPPIGYRLGMQWSYLRPPWLRRQLYRWQRRGTGRRPYYLRPPYLEAVIDPSFPHTSPLFRIGSISDPRIVARVASVEFVCQRIADRASVA